MANLTKGANKVCEFSLFATDGSTPKPATDFDLIVAIVSQFGRVMATYTYDPNDAMAYDDDEIRTGSSTNIVEVEIDVTLSASFKEGPVVVKLVLDETDAEFTEDTFHRCIPSEEVFTIVR